MTASDEVAGAGDHDRRAVAAHAADLGQPGQEPVVDRGGRPEPEPLLGVDAGDDPGGRVEGHEPARVDQRDPVGQALGLLHEVGDEDDRHAAVADVLDELPGVAPGLRVEAGGELVEDRDPRVADERERDREPLLLAARELAELRTCACRRARGRRAAARQSPGLRVERGVEVQRLPDRGSGRAARSPGAGRRRRDGARRGRAAGRARARGSCPSRAFAAR